MYNIHKTKRLAGQKSKSRQGIDGGLVKMGGKSSLAEKLLIKTGS